MTNKNSIMTKRNGIVVRQMCLRGHHDYDVVVVGRCTMRSFGYVREWAPRTPRMGRSTNIRQGCLVT